MPAALAPVYQHSVPLGVTSFSGWKLVPTGSPRVHAPVVAFELAPSTAHPVAVSNVSFTRVVVRVPVWTRIVLLSSGQLTPKTLDPRVSSIGVPQDISWPISIL